MINEKVWVNLNDKDSEYNSYLKSEYNITKESEGFICSTHVDSVTGNLICSVVFEEQGVILELDSKYLKVIRVDMLSEDYYD